MPPAPVPPRRSIAVLGFANLSGRPELDWLSTALAEMLARELAAGERLRTISGESVARMRAELALAAGERLSREMLVRIRHNLGCDLVVAGSYLARGTKGMGELRLDLSLDDAASGEPIAAASETAVGGAQLLDLVSRLASRLRAQLGVEGVSEAEAGGARAAHPADPEAARLYAEGLARLRLFDPLGARDRLEQAVAVDAHRPLVHSALAAAWSVLGYDARAEAHARRAFELSGSLPREERLVVEGRYREMARQWGRAIEIYRALWGLFPDTLDYALLLADAQTSAGQGQEALATVESLRTLPPPASDDARIDLAEAQAAESISDFRREQAAAARAAHKGRSREQRLLVARATLMAAWAWRNLGGLDKAASAAEEARGLFGALGDRGGVARATNTAATVLRQQGRLDRALRMDEEALAVFRETGDQRRVSWALNNLGLAALAEAHLREAEARFGESLAISREIGDASGHARALSNMGIVLQQHGRLSEASARFEEALALGRVIGEKRGVAWPLANLASALLDQGDLPRAERTFEESLAVFREIGEKRAVAFALRGLASVRLEQGDLGAARKLNDESLALLQEIGDRRSRNAGLFEQAEQLLAEGNLAEARSRHEEALALRSQVGDLWFRAGSILALATVSLEEGRAEEAGRLAQEAGELFRREKAIDLEAATQALLARAFLAQGRRDDALKAIHHASLLSGDSQSRRVRLSVAIVADRIRAALGGAADAARATRRLEASLADAQDAGLVRLVFEARLALAEIQATSGRAPAGRAQLEAFAREAKAKGFGLLARKAAGGR